MRGEKRKRTPTWNDRIHPRNMYKVPPDFDTLIKEYPALGEFTTITKHGKNQFKWTEPRAVRELTKVLLHKDFGLTWDIPLNRLCPPLTNRLNYIHWIEDLILLSRPAYISQEKDSPIWGVDIGTGASCIYPLLGNRLNQWHFIATDINQESFEFASSNINSNSLSNCIQLKLVNSSTMLPIDDIKAHAPITFSMCNPPFFESMEEADVNPRTCCTGSESEMTTPGGEVAFIERMINESLLLKTDVRWYTSLIGRKSSLRPLLAVLRANGIRNTRTTEFHQGRTVRWGLAWSFTEDGLVENKTTSEHKVLSKRKEANRRHEMEFHMTAPDDDISIIDLVHERILQSAQLTTTEEVSVTTTLFNSSNTSRIYGITATSSFGDILWQSHATVLSSKSTCTITLSWLSGHSRNQFWIFADKWKSTILRTNRSWRKRKETSSSST